MKTFILSFLCVAIGATGGLLVGRSSAPSVRIEGIEMHAAEGMPSPEVLSAINGEMHKRIERVVGPDRALQHLIVLTPGASGYEVWTVGPSDSRIWSHQARHFLQVGERINELRDALSKTQKDSLEQAAPSDGDRPVD